MATNYYKPMTKEEAIKIVKEYNTKKGGKAQVIEVTAHFAIAEDPGVGTLYVTHAGVTDLVPQ